jgi:hypothetical protein
MAKIVRTLKKTLRTYKRKFGKYGDALADAAMASATPSIFVNTLPKSGSVFILGSLRKSTGMKFHKIAYGYYPWDLIDYKKIKVFGRGGKIALQHLDAHPLNLIYLEQYAKRWVLHLRDPRGSLLSWVHHLDRLHREEMYDTLQLYPFVPKDYFQWKMPKKIDWQIENYLTQTIEWIRGWGEYHARSPRNMLVTTHNELSSDSETHIARILQFYNIAQPKVTLVEKNIDNHFRKGEKAEWKGIFTPTQLTDARKMCDELSSVFPRLDYLVD